MDEGIWSAGESAWPMIQAQYTLAFPAIRGCRIHAPMPRLGASFALWPLLKLIARWANCLLALRS